MVSADPMTLKSISSLVHGAIASPVSEKRVMMINTKRLATAALFRMNLLRASAQSERPLTSAMSVIRDRSPARSLAVTMG